jgi:predicted ribosomally synthesized peptide with SipW-like signal peptide
MKLGKDKIGAMFVIAMLSLAGIGIAYAGWTDTIQITGTISTGSVDWDIIEYSGTWKNNSC